jgi:hypothetical protein
MVIAAANDKKFKIFYDAHFSFKTFTPIFHKIESSHNACTTLVFIFIIFFLNNEYNFAKNMRIIKYFYLV